MNQIFMVYWTGRDEESGFWQSKLQEQFGFFIDVNKAHDFVNKLNELDPPVYDEEAEDDSKYAVYNVKFTGDIESDKWLDAYKSMLMIK